MSEFYRADRPPPEPYKMTPAEEALRDYLMGHMARWLYEQRGEIYRAGDEPTEIVIPLPHAITSLKGATFLGLPLMASAAIDEPVIRSKRGHFPSRLDLDQAPDFS